MKHYKIDMQGKFYNQKVADASALVWQASDEGRTVYDETTEAIWVADSSDWKQAGGGDVPPGTSMWLYENSPPDGWSLNGAAGDTLLAVKGGSTYTTGGAAAGTWSSLFSHVHSAGSLTAASHYHPWYVWNGSDGYTYDSDGATPLYFSSFRDSKHTRGLMSETTHADTKRWNKNSYTGSAVGGSVSGNSGGATTTSGRPYAQVGIICTKT
jgi:hypothetical protein